MTPDRETRTHDPNPPTGTHDPALDAGLAAAFGPDPTPGGWSQPPLLRDDPSEHAPLVHPSSAEMPRGSDSRYQLLGEIARGGMGVVLKGRDPDLGRDLAFKVLRAELATRPAAVQRFVEEAQVGGQLQHPGVVPVYDLGRFADGRPYFAMKLVKGRTLADLLAERTPAADGSPSDRGKFLQVFLQVCQTIAYAHAKGVIHRDLKPSNVMVGAFGEVLVMDWGLAKVLPRGGVADELRATQASRGRQRPEESHEPTVIHTARAGSLGSDTQAGSVMGTPAFMPPEQAGGEVEKLDERADVFGLGALLCVILTGQPPYVADTADAVRLMAIRGDLEDAFARLDSCSTDAELVDLCKRCLAPKRDARPRHAGEVAGAVAEYLAAVEQRAHDAELERVEADARAAEEVNTRREAEARAASERKRRKLQAVAGSLVTLVVLVGGALATWQWQRAQREEKRTREALARVTEEQDRTFAALKAMTDEGISHLFQAQAEPSEEQRAFVQKVIALYDAATRSSLDTPEGRSRRAEGHTRVGRLRAHIDDRAGATESYQAAIGLLSPLVEEFPDEPKYRYQLAVTRSRLGVNLSELNRDPESEAECRRACDLLASLVAADGNNLDYRWELGRARANYSRTLRRLKKPAEGEREIRAAMAILRDLCARAPDNREYAGALAGSYGTLLGYLDGNPVLYEQTAREAVALVGPLRKRYPTDLVIHRTFALSHNNLGVALSRLNRHAEAADESRIGRDARLEIANRYPMIRMYREELASAHRNLAIALGRLNRRREAAAEDAAAVAVYQRLIAEVPTNREYRSNCIGCLQRLGGYQASLRTAAAFGEAEGHYRAALKLIDEFLATDPNDRGYRRISIATHEAIGRVLADRREQAGAVAEFRTALAQLEPLMAELPNDRELLHLRGQARFNLGLPLKALDQVADAQASFQSALADLEVLARQDEKDFQARNVMARCHEQLALIQLGEARFAEALAEYRKEQDIRTRLVADSPTPQNRDALGWASVRVGYCLKELGRHPEAEKEFRAALPIFRQLVAEFPNNRTYQWHLADSLVQLGHLLITQQRFAEVEKPAAEADALYAELYKVSSADPGLRRQYAMNTSYLAAARAHTGDHTSAGQLLTKMVALDPNSVSGYYNAACVLNYCVLAAERNPKLTGQQRKDLVNEYTDRALGYLRRAVELAAGAEYLERREFDKVRTDKDLDVFRSHPQFQKILAAYEKLPALAPPPREKR